MSRRISQGLKAAVIAFLMTAQASSVTAQDLPIASPQSDLYVRVRVAGFASPVELRRSGQKTRLDVTSGGVLQSYIADRDKGVLIALTANGQSRLALVFPLDRAEGIIPLPLDLSVLTTTATVKPIGATIVAGKSCRLMEFSNYLGQSGIICATNDNIILQMTKQGRREPLFQVTDIAVTRQDPKWFRAPPDYQVTVVPLIGGASGQAAIPQPVDPRLSPPKSIKP